MSLNKVSKTIIYFKRHILCITYHNIIIISICLIDYIKVLKYFINCLEFWVTKL